MDDDGGCNCGDDAEDACALSGNSTFMASRAVAERPPNEGVGVAKSVISGMYAAGASKPSMDSVKGDCARPLEDTCREAVRGLRWSTLLGKARCSSGIT